MKLVSETGVGTVAAGVAKAKADVVLISGYDGGTGASPKTSIMHTGLPWEMGLAEANQTLILNGLRNRIKIECDGQLKTGRDVVIAALLGADEFGFATAPLISLGCIMMRKCHLNTCPVGIATQDVELRKLFKGKPENVINFFHFVAEEMRQLMAELGFRTVDEMVGRVDLLKQSEDVDHRKAKNLDLDALLFNAKPPPEIGAFDVEVELDPMPGSIDEYLISKYDDSESVQIKIGNENRSVGTMLSSSVTAAGKSKDFTIYAKGSGGQSTGAFLTKGLRLEIEGEVNDYLGKGLSGGTIILTSPKNISFDPARNTIAGNVAFYGATSGVAFISGRAGERFCVRNSGVKVVVEGVGDHGCEYMTGGRVVILGSTGRNFGAGMSGGYAYVYDIHGDFKTKCNLEMIRLDKTTGFHDKLRAYIELHLAQTGSKRAREILQDWKGERHKFIRVIPIEFEKGTPKRGAEIF